MIIKVARRIIDRRLSSPPMKPPNIGIFQRSGDVEDVYAIASTELSKCLNIDRYAFVRIDENVVRLGHKWADNVRLVVICGKTAGIDTDILQEFQKHFNRGGKFLDVSTSQDFLTEIMKPNWKRLTTSSASVRVSGNNCPTHLMNEHLLCIRETSSHAETGHLRSLVQTDDGVIVVGSILEPATVAPKQSDVGFLLFSQIRLEVDTPLALTFWQTLLTDQLQLDCSRPAATAVSPCYLMGISESHCASFLASIGPHLSNETELQGSRLTLAKSVDGVDTFAGNGDDEDRILLLLGTPSIRIFDRQIYFRQLTSTQLGHVVIFGRIVPSTMDLISSYVAPHGTVVIAGRQTKGRGRSNHSWLSPEGCAMFSVHLRLPLTSAIGRRPSFVQHLAAMAAVQGILTLPGYKNLDVKIKWPNDIYYGKSVKIGGIFVQSSIADSELRCVIGVGLNLSNEHPTKCINDIIAAHDHHLPPLTPEVSIARTLSRLETLLDTFESSAGVQEILQQYYDLWIHQNAEVKLSLEAAQGQPKKAVIQGLDDDGFLVVKLDDDGAGSLYSVQPDGNSFDVLENMVVVRRQTTSTYTSATTMR